MKKYVLILASFGVLVVFGLSGFIKVVKSEPAESKKISRKVNTTHALGLYTKPFSPELEMSQQTSKPGKAEHEQLLKNIAQLPLMFQKNMGQWREEILYRGVTPTAIVGFRKNGVTFFSSREIDEHNEGNDKEDGELVESMIWNLSFKGMNGNTEIVAEGEQAGVTNYLLGNDSTKWVRNTPESRLINYKGIYDNIDLHYYGLENNKLEYDYIVKPKGKMSDILMELEGAGNLKINNKGELIITTPWGEITEAKPFSYQMIKGVKKEIDIRYQIIDEKTFGFKVYGRYNKNYDLVVDPKILIWTTFTKGNGQTHYVQDIGIDANRNSYTTGWTDGNFDISSGVKQTTFGGSAYDAWVCKFNRRGTALVYCTYLGGSDDERGFGIVVSSTGEAYVTGITKSTNYPVSGGTYPSFQSSLAGSADIFVSALNATGTNFVYSTYFGGGGADEGRAIFLNSSNEVYVTGQGKKNSTPFPTTAGVVQPSGDGSGDAFVLKLDATGARVFCTLLGGTNSKDDEGYDIYVSNTGEIYITGGTEASGNYPTSAGAYQTTTGGGAFDAFVTKLDANATSILYSTFLGGGGADTGYGIFVDNSGQAYIAGTAGSGFPTIAGNYQSAFGGGTYDSFVTKLNASGSARIYSTYLGGTLDEGGPDGDYKANDIVVNGNGEAYVSGITGSANFPTTNDGYDPAYTANDDGFIVLLAADGKSLKCTTFMGAEKDDYKKLSIVLDATGGATDTLYATITVHSNTAYDVAPLSVGTFPIAETQGTVYSKKHLTDGKDQVAVFKTASCVVSPLPITLMSFKGSNQRDHNLLEWTTATEINNDYFGIERSSDGVNFVPIGIVDGAGNSNTLLNYSYSDHKEGEETIYYRLKQTDIDGKTSYSKVVVINGPEANKALTLTITNPVTDYLNYRICCLEKGDAKVEVIEMSGKIILSTNIQVNEGFNKLALDAKNIVSGAYILKFTSNNGIVTAKFVK